MCVNVKVRSPSQKYQSQIPLEWLVLVFIKCFVVYLIVVHDTGNSFDFGNEILAQKKMSPVGGIRLAGQGFIYNAKL